MGTFNFTAAGVLLISFATPFLLAAAMFMILSPIMPERAEAVKQSFPRVIIGIVIFSASSTIVTAAAALKASFPTAIQPLFGILAPLVAPGLFLLSFYYLISVVAPEWGAKADKHLGNIVFGIIFISIITTLVTNLDALI